MKKIFSLIAVMTIAAVFFAAGCKRGEDSAEKKLKVGYSTPSMANQFWNRVAGGIKEVADKNDVELIVADANSDSGKQLSDVEDLIQKRVDALLISPWDTDTAAVCIKKANRAKIPVIVVDIGTSGGEYNAFIISDNKEGGRLAGRFVAEKLGNKGKVVHIQCQLGARNAQLRGEGFEEIMKEKGIKIAARQPADSKRDLGMTVMENILQANSDIGAVFAQNDEMALGALRAIEAAGLKGKVLVVGFDGNEDAKKSIAAGGMAATVEQQPESMGATAMETALKVIKGEKAEKDILVQVKLITKDALK